MERRRSPYEPAYHRDYGEQRRMEELHERVRMLPEAYDLTDDEIITLLATT